MSERADAIRPTCSALLPFTEDAPARDWRFRLDSRMGRVRGQEQ
jgi:hypothetical protein